MHDVNTCLSYVFEHQSDIAGLSLVCSEAVRASGRSCVEPVSGVLLKYTLAQAYADSTLSFHHTIFTTYFTFTLQARQTRLFYTLRLAYLFSSEDGRKQAAAFAIQ